MQATPTASAAGPESVDRGAVATLAIVVHCRRQREDAENFVMVSPPRKRERDELDGELVDRPARVLVSA